MPALPANDIYRSEYTKAFVSNWDELINWDGREEGEAEFFERLLNAYGVEHIADIACGTGYHTVNLAHKGFKVTATDGTPTMLERTKANAREHGIELHDLRCVDWLNLKGEFGECAFDAVICLGNAFTHLFEHEARRDMLAAVYAVLKPGGLVIIDHRNYDSILDQGYSSKHRYYYTGENVEVRPVEISRTMVKFEYAFDSGETHHLTLYPLKQNYVSHLFEDAGFMDITRYGDFERPYDHYDPDFIQQVGFKPKRPVRHSGPADKLTLTQRFVAATKRYYDGAADQIYREIWGENIHLGLFEDEKEGLPAAMARSNRRMAEGVGLGTEHEVLEVACGYGALARYLARTFGCRVLASNISERELSWARELTEKAGLADRVQLEYGDFHELPYANGRFDFYWSQEAFLHAVDKAQVLSEAYRVLKPGGTLVFTDILVRSHTPDEIRERIYERVNAPEMWDASDYRQGLSNLGFDIRVEEDWSSNVAPTYGWVRGQLERRRGEFEERIGRELVDRTSRALQFWVDRAREGYIGWLYVVARK
ncbi:MAG: methyltransferase domain-containing protein [Gammaproteobacteria bacterium]|nr:methyltransferase domain-containing protein [Gammaproteobacteria bacterium]NIR83167.1 methyltransferase domain-containing protein [Gammaproteobacteria bacterium]NIR90975.1 methyltransferase domain-containing protein [Gammaproteobacteria bacterium]NIU04332.1 methyltransferase domain-containing protein [Gammaproteobacteria bacterium]NIV52555.1 methyltransferase domain-containing protein [Gammaproteobacteria bacterium]